MSTLVAPFAVLGLSRHQWKKKIETIMMMWLHKFETAHQHRNGRSKSGKVFKIYEFENRFVSFLKTFFTIFELSGYPCKKRNWQFLIPMVPQKKNFVCSDLDVGNQAFTFGDLCVSVWRSTKLKSIFVKISAPQFLEKEKKDNFWNWITLNK